MAHLKTEIDKIFNELNEDLQNNPESSMTIYECFDFQEEDKDKFINAIYHLIDDGVAIVQDDKMQYNKICDEFINTIISCNHILAQMIIEELCDRHIISWEFCKNICYLIDNKYQEYLKANPPMPLEEAVKDFNELIKHWK